ncbi:butyrate--CoA ligase AAE11, peroxisomal-like [Durio zibethinus]|uniref:Butyrate--CoA ligase AAE11, peroxisomal-like n=1 Tax=Durio zibethinus TaxID=66656 RepID=A0A6P6AYS9_DURZI|nr:butyrate--CoA ligase AAE11, peroxisomal-like [Durio zibethinus]
MDQLPKCKANYVPLTPLTFLKRASSAYASRTSLIYETTRFTWRQTYERCCRLASSLLSLNILKNDVVSEILVYTYLFHPCILVSLFLILIRNLHLQVSVLAPNVPAMYEMHFAVPMAGAVLNTINTRLDAKNVATILRHSEAKAFFVDYQYVPLAREALRILMGSSQEHHSSSAAAESSIPLVIVIDDIDSPTGVRLGELEYEQLVHMGNPGFVPTEIQDEWDPISLNYTSGTTSEPKGVVYSHRGAYLSSLSLILCWEMRNEPVFLWSLPMFHCNGWTFTWGSAARGGTNICLRNTTAYDMYRNIASHKVTHMCCAPIVFNIILDAKPHERCKIASPVQILTGGAPPPPSLLEKMEHLGFQVTHAYGLTEATGPALVCEWQAEWNNLPQDHQARLKARQGVGILTLADVDVKNMETMTSVPHDGKTMGEIVLRGSSIMKGYLKEQEATSKAFKNGWFITGDVGVIHPDGYLEIKDRSKDVIISGGENISSVELESVLYRHPRVLEAAVVAMPHPRWGESPCAFIAVRENAGGQTDDVKEADIISYCRKSLPHFMVPKKVEFLPQLPKTSTGKMQKFQLRALAKTFQVTERNSTQVNKEDPPIHSQSHLQILAFSRL